MQKAVDEAILQMVDSDNPAELGRYKQNLRIFSYDLGRKYRIIYNMNWAEHVIEIIRVCDHKSAYGKD
jgi:mRNA-degrading endonuclease RelE of RelBE toxin-antitoxin system